MAPQQTGIDVPWKDYSYSTFDAVFETMSQRQKDARHVRVSIKGGENELSAKKLLRYYQTPRDVDMSASLCQDFFLNKEISFFTVDPKTETKVREIHHFVYGGGDITEKFDHCPWLLDILFDMAQGLLIKKLMPPSLDLGTPESGSEESQSPATPTQ